ncbi:MAG: ester cyclase [Candidatus Puniceispirillaceae bacterium]|jgi:predicted ester cyclase
MTDIHHQHKATIKTLSSALYDFDEMSVRKLLDRLISDTAICRFFHPVGDVLPGQLYDRVFAPLVNAMPDVERRDIICIAGEDQQGRNWVGCAGHYLGRFIAPFMDIPPTGHIAHIRYHEFFCLCDGTITEIQVLWDLPDLMMQAGVWPMGPSLGREGYVPAPASQDGLAQGQPDDALTAQNLQHVLDMLTAMQQYPAKGGAEVMQLERYWHPHFNWYGPSGVGSCRGIDGFRRFHQTPFLKAMPDRGQYPEQTSPHFFADGAYVAVTGWPNMAQTLSHDGWLGIAPTDSQVRLRSLDFWRIENGRIRENWVLVDLLDLWSQLRVDVLARMTELASARPEYQHAVLQEAR